MIFTEHIIVPFVIEQFLFERERKKKSAEHSSGPHFQKDEGVELLRACDEGGRAARARAGGVGGGALSCFGSDRAGAWSSPLTTREKH